MALRRHASPSRKILIATSVTGELEETASPQAASTIIGAAIARDAEDLSTSSRSAAVLATRQHRKASCTTSSRWHRRPPAASPPSAPTSGSSAQAIADADIDASDMVIIAAAAQASAVMKTLTGPNFDFQSLVVVGVCPLAPSLPSRPQAIAVSANAAPPTVEVSRERGQYTTSDKPICRSSTVAARWPLSSRSALPK